MSSSHEEIRILLGRYCELMDAGDFSGLGDLLSQSVLTDAKGRPFARGAEDVRSQWADRTVTYDGSPRTRHLTTNSIIEVDEAAGMASARSAYVVLQAPPGQPLHPVISGRYEDRFSRGEDGAWAFAERRYFVDLVSDLSAHLRGAPPDVS